MLKICFLITTLDNQGPVRVLHNIIKYLDKKKYDVYIITLNPEKLETTLIDEFRIMNVKIISCNIRTYQGIFLWKHKVDKIIKKIDPDILHGHCLKSSLVLKIIKYKKPIFFTLHQYGKEDFEAKFGFFKGNIINKIYMWSYKEFNLIACSKSLVKRYKENYSIEMSCIQNGVDYEYTKPMIETNEKLKKELQIRDNEKIIISVGSLCERKNPLLIADAVENLRSSGHSIKVIFLGVGKKLEELKNKNGSIVLGKVANVKEYLGMSDIFISSSFSEGLPNSVLEAMSQKKKILLSNIPPHLELLENSGDLEKKIFEPSDVAQLEQKILETLNENNSSGESNYKKFILNFTAKIMSEKYMKEYKKYELNDVKK